MTQFQGLPRAVLVAISEVSGEAYHDVDGPGLVPVLKNLGHEPDATTLRNLMDRLRDDGYVTFQGSFGGGDEPGEGLFLIRLAERGRQEVEGWPRPGELSRADIEALIHAFEAVAVDPDTPEPQRKKANALAEAARDLGVDVAGNVVASWLRMIGVG